MIKGAFLGRFEDSFVGEIKICFIFKKLINGKKFKIFDLMIFLLLKIFNYYIKDNS